MPSLAGARLPPTPPSATAGSSRRPAPGADRGAAPAGNAPTFRGRRAARRTLLLALAAVLLVASRAGAVRAQAQRPDGSPGALPDGLVVEPRASPPYEPWMLARLDRLREVDPPAVLLGDSLVAGWPGTLHPRLLPAGAVNLGAGGDTTANLLWRLRRALGPGMWMREALLLVGTNDLPLRSGELIAGGVGAAAAAVLEAAPRVCLTVIGLLPRRDGRADFDAAVRDANRRLAAGLPPGVRFVDAYDRLRAACPATGACALYKDTVHLTRDGYTLLGALVDDAAEARPCAR